MASAELQIPEHIQETQNITREELEMILHTQNPLVTEEQLLLLWYTLFKYGCRQIPAFFGTDFVLL